MNPRLFMRLMRGPSAGAVDVTPDDFSFTPYTGASRNQAVVGEPSAPLSGLSGPTPLTVVGGTVSINGGAFVSSGLVQNDDVLTPAGTASPTYSTDVGVPVTVGTFTTVFVISTQAAPASSADITTDAELRGFLAQTVSGFAGKRTVTIAPGTYAQLTSAQIGTFKNFTANPIALVAFDPDDKPIITGTGLAPCVNMQGWQGITWDGIAFIHDEIGLTGDANNMGCVQNVNGHNQTYIRCLFSGSNPSGSNYVRGLNGNSGGASNKNNKVQQCKFTKLHRGVVQVVSENLLIELNLFTDLTSDGINHNSGSTSAITRKNLFFDFSAATTAHPDGIQPVATGTQVNTDFLVEDNGFMATSDNSAFQAFNASVSNGAANNLGWAIRRNQIYGVEYNAINCANVGDLTVADNVAWARFGSTYWPKFNFFGSTGTYSGNRFAELANIGSMTDAGGNSVVGNSTSDPAKTKTAAEIVTLMQDFRALYPLIPT